MKMLPFIRARTIAVTAICVSLTACATRPEPVVITKIVPTPVSTPCITRSPEQPAYAADTVDLESNIYELVRALLIDREQRKIETGELRATITGCQ